MSNALVIYFVFSILFILSMLVVFLRPLRNRYASTSLYHKLGGEAAVNAAASIFCRKVLADDRIKHFFDSIDKNRQAKKQKAFLTFAFGGSSNHGEADLIKDHDHLVASGLNDAHFDVILEHLGATLKELKIQNSLIAQCVAAVESTRNSCCRPAPEVPAIATLTVNSENLIE